jgi:transcriptional regulator with XRE-family HTH domain
LSIDHRFGEILKRQRLAARPQTVRLGGYERLPVRVGRPVTQEEIAEAVGVSRTWYALLEAGAAHPSSSLANRIADALMLEPAERLALLRFAIPEIESALAHLSEPDDIRLVVPLRLALPIATPAEIETTARRLAHAREEFILTGKLSPDARPRIVNSWLRISTAVDAHLKVAPLPFARDAQLADLRAANEPLLRAAGPVIRFLVEQLADAGYVVVLTDRIGRILSIEGDASVRRRLARLDFVPGGDWSEAGAGTNAIGTVLVDGRPLQILGAEHFCEGWQHLTCTAAPIRDPGTQAILGALDITGGYKLIRDHLLALIMRSALDIEDALIAYAPPVEAVR